MCFSLQFRCYSYDIRCLHECRQHVTLQKGAFDIFGVFAAGKKSTRKIDKFDEKRKLNYSRVNKQLNERGNKMRFFSSLSDHLFGPFVCLHGCHDVHQMDFVQF